MGIEAASRPRSSRARQFNFGIRAKRTYTGRRYLFRNRYWVRNLLHRGDPGRLLAAREQKQQTVALLLVQELRAQG